MPPEISWLFLGRYALLIALTDLIPIPLVDQGVEIYLRRRLVRRLGERHGVELDDATIKLLADMPIGCTGCFWSVLCWPFKKILKTIAFVFQLKSIADVSSEMIHRGLLIEEAFEFGWLPDEPERVRLAMDIALSKVDTRVVERSVRGTFADHRDELNLLIHEATNLARAQTKPGEALGDAADEGLSEAGEGMSRALAAALQSTGVVPELVHWFRAEMGEPPRVPVRLDGGVITPEAVLPADDAESDPTDEGPQVEDANELPGEGVEGD
jgi:hypothetical protein